MIVLSATELLTLKWLVKTNQPLCYVNFTSIKKKKRCVGVGELTHRLYHQVSWQTTASPPESIWLILLGTRSTNIYQVQVLSLCQRLVDTLNKTGRAMPQRTDLPVVESGTGQANLCSFQYWGRGGRAHQEKNQGQIWRPEQAPGFSRIITV